MMYSVSAYSASPAAVFRLSARLSTKTTWPGGERSTRLRICVARATAWRGLPGRDGKDRTSTRADRPGGGRYVLETGERRGRRRGGLGDAGLSCDFGCDPGRTCVAADGTLPVERHAPDRTTRHRSERVVDEQ